MRFPVPICEVGGLRRVRVCAEPSETFRVFTCGDFAAYFSGAAEFCPIAVTFVANTLHSARVGEFSALVKPDGRACSTAVYE